MRKIILLLPFVIIFAISILASFKLFNSLFFTSHDGEGHVIRIIEFASSLQDGQFPVRLAKGINFGLGYPYFNFNYPFIYYLAIVFYFIGFSAVTSFKILLFLSVLLSGFGMYLFSKVFFGKISALMAAIFYILVPYRFLNMYVRGAVAEAFALGLLPFQFLAVEYLILKKRFSILFFIVILSILIMSHNITVFLTTPLLTLYFVLRIFKKKKRIELIKKYISAFVFSALLTAFFWFPALLESRLTKLADLTNDYRLFFPSVQEIIYSPWGFGFYVQGDVPGKMSPQIGLIHIGIALIALCLLVWRLIRRKREENDLVMLGFIGVALICFFLLFPFSIFIWDHAFYLQLVQHPWRLIGYIVFPIAFAAGYVISFIKNKKLVIGVSIFLVLCLVYFNRNHIRVNMYVEFNNPFESSLTYGPSTTSKDEHMPRLAPRIFEQPPVANLIASTSGTFKRDVWTSNYHKFMLNLSEAAEFRDNTSYFPGWEVYIDGQKAQILYEKDEFYRLRVEVPEGKHIVESKFGETWYRLFADIISILTFCCIVIVSVIQCVLWQKQKTKNLTKSHRKFLNVRNAK